MGFLIDSQLMKILLIAEKITQIVETCKRLRQEGSLTVRELARLIGRLTGTLPSPAVVQGTPASEENQSIQKFYSLEISLTLTEEAMLELEWWATKMKLENGKSMLA